jgi:hypothetical protein
VHRLVARGLVNDDGSFTPSGAALQQRIEDKTDVLPRPAWQRLGEDGSRRRVGEDPDPAGVLGESKAEVGGRGAVVVDYSIFGCIPRVRSCRVLPGPRLGL